MMLSFAVATPTMIKMEPLPMFVCGGPGKLGAEDKQAAVDEYVNHLRVYVSESLKELPTPRLTASVDLVTEGMKLSGQRSNP